MVKRSAAARGAWIDFWSLTAAFWSLTAGLVHGSSWCSAFTLQDEALRLWRIDFLVGLNTCSGATYGLLKTRHIAREIERERASHTFIKQRLVSL